MTIKMIIAGWAILIILFGATCIIADLAVPAGAPSIVMQIVGTFVIATAVMAIISACVAIFIWGFE